MSGSAAPIQPAPPPPIGRGSSPIGLIVTLAVILTFGCGMAWSSYTNRRAAETRKAADYANKQEEEKFKKFLREHVGDDISRIGKYYGFCRLVCDSVLGAEFGTSWQFVAKDVVLWIFLNSDRHPVTRELGYRLRLQYSSSRDDGDIAPVNPALQKVIDLLLQHFDYPRTYLWPTPKVWVERENAFYAVRFDQYRPALGSPYHHNGYESLRGTRLVSVSRYGPFSFDEEGAWLRER